MMQRRLASLCLLTAFMVVSAVPVQAAHGSEVVHSSATASVGPLPNIVQTLNNCGPASVAEVLAYWHIERSQEQVASVLRADGSSWGMAPYGVPAYARSVGLEATIGVAGSEKLVKALLSNGFPVIVSQWVGLSYRVGHYRPIEAYDDRSRLFISSDPYLGPDHPITYVDFARLWGFADGRFLVIYPPSRARLLAAVLGSASWNRTAAYRHDLAQRKDRLRSHKDNVPGTARWYYSYAALAWDEAELGQYAAARLALRAAAARGTSPIIIRWIEQEFHALQSKR